MDKKKIYVVDTSYLISRKKLPTSSDIIIPYQVMSEMLSNKMQSQKRLQGRLCYVIKKLTKMSNVFFQSYKTKQLYHNLFNIHRGDYDGYVLSAALFMKLCYPFRKVINDCLSPLASPPVR